MTRRTRSPRRIAVVAGAITVLSLALPAYAADESVDIKDNSFDPSTVTIREGDTVTWENSGDNPHTVTGSGFDSGSLSSGEDYSRTFKSEGTFSYSCTFHPGMNGTVVVRGTTAARGDVDDDVSAAGSGTGLAGTGPEDSRRAMGVAAVALIALGAWLLDLQRIASARHRIR